MAFNNLEQQGAHIMGHLGEARGQMFVERKKGGFGVLMEDHQAL